ncbi:MAG TPA: right-handed parallel beta-helix repeat-containing protein [Gemmataceae bacterium]|nr:right-handed parallel beta-helix repeat-containing protein [Gemmataceae bacterium]
MRHQQFSRLRVRQFESRTLLSTYFVGTTGSDLNAGTSTAPWATLQYAVDHVKPGDTVQVLAGTYQGCRIGTSGTALAPITLEAAPGAKVVINAPGAKNAHGSDIEVENFSQTVSYWTIQGLEVKNAPTAGIDIRNTNHITVQNCYCHNNYNWGIFLAFSNYPTLTHNHCSYSQTQHGIYDSNSGDYATVTYNTCDHNHDCGIQFNADVSMGGKGYMVGNLIAGNILHDNGAGGGAALNFDGLVSSTIENNLLYNNLASGIVLYKNDAAVGSQNNIVVNNTIVMPATGRWAITISNGSTGNVLYNNIIVQQNLNRGALEIDSSSLTGFQSDYNVFSGGVYFSTDGGNTRLSLSSWQSGMAHDQHSLAAATDQLFANLAGNNYHLAAGSPAINHGTFLDAPTIDLTGRLRTNTYGVDIGCYDYPG